MIALAAFLFATVISSGSASLMEAAPARHAPGPDAKVGAIKAIRVNETIWRLALGADGGIWFATTPPSGGIGAMPYIGRLDTTTLLIKPYILPNVLPAADPIAAPDGNVWFVEGLGLFGRGSALKITPSGEITIFNGGTIEGPLKLGPDGALWGTAGTQTSTFVRVTLDGKYSTVTAPQIPSQPRGQFSNGLFTFGPGGNIWYCNITYPYQALDEMTPSGQFVAAYPVSADYCSIITYGVDGNIYTDLTNQYLLTQTTPAGQMTVYSQYSPIDSDMHPDPVDGSLWLGSGNILVEFWPATGETKTYALGDLLWPWSFVIDHKHNWVWFLSLADDSNIYRLTIAPPQKTKRTFAPPRRAALGGNTNSQ